MAGAGYKLFATGDVLTAAQVNTYLMEQTVMRFADSAARTTALSGVLAEGMVSYLQDTNTLEVYDGAAWVGATGDITGLTAGTGISISSATGPVPTVTNSMATEITAKGDLIVGTGSATFDNLAAGSNGETLVADSSASTGLKWAKSPNFVGCAVYGVFQTIANATYTAVLFAYENFDTDGFHSTTTNTSRITIPTGLGGYYLVNMTQRWDPSTGVAKTMQLYKNGSAVFTYDTGAATGLYPMYSRSTIVKLNAGDYIEMYVYQNSGGNLVFYGRDEEQPFQVQFLGA
jgi:hypothetical protein